MATASHRRNISRTDSNDSNAPSISATHVRYASNDSNQTFSTGKPRGGKEGKPEKDGKGKGGKWLINKINKMTGWLSTSEPSLQALKQHKKEVFQNAGISSSGDPQAYLKLHLPGGDIPEDAIRPSKGPSPEDVARKQVAQRRGLNELRMSYTEGKGPRGQGPWMSQTSFGLSSSGSGSKGSSRKGSVSTSVGSPTRGGFNNDASSGGGNSQKGSVTTMASSDGK